MILREQRMLRSRRLGVMGMCDTLYDARFFYPQWICVRLIQHEWHNDQVVTPRLRRLLRLLLERLAALCSGQFSEEQLWNKLCILIVRDLDLGESCLDPQNDFLAADRAWFDPEEGGLTSVFQSEESKKASDTGLELKESIDSLDGEVAALAAGLGCVGPLQAFISRSLGALSPSRVFQRWGGRATPLRLAAAGGEMETFTLLMDQLEHSWDTSRLDETAGMNFQFTLMHLASYGGTAHLRRMLELLEKHRINWLLWSGSDGALPPLFCALRRSRLEAADTLLAFLPNDEIDVGYDRRQSKRVTVDRRAQTLNSALMYLCQKGYPVSSIEYLIARGAETRTIWSKCSPDDTMIRSAYSYALQCGHVHLLRRLIRHGADPNPPDMIEAASGILQYDDVATFYAALHLGTYFRGVPLYTACCHGHLNMLRVMLRAFPDSLHNGEADVALRHACLPVHVRADMVALLLRKGVAVAGPLGACALFDAVVGGSPAIVQLLLGRGADTTRRHRHVPQHPHYGGGGGGGNDNDADFSQEPVTPLQMAKRRMETAAPEKREAYREICDLLLVHGAGEGEGDVAGPLGVCSGPEPPVGEEHVHG